MAVKKDMNSPHRLLARDDLRAAIDQDREEPDADRHVDQRRHQRLAGLGADRGAGHLAGGGAEPVLLITLHRVQLDRRDAVEDLVQPRGAAAGDVAQQVRLSPDVALHDEAGRDQKRRADHRHQRPDRIDQQRHDHQRHQPHPVAPRVGQEPGPDRLDRGDVALHALDQRARRVDGEVAAVQPQDVGQKVLLYPRRGVHADPHQDHPLGHACHGAQAEEAEDPEADQRDHVGPPADEDDVEHRLEHVGQQADRAAL